MRILITEDENDLLQLLEDNLSREGHNVITAETGKEAWIIFEHKEITAQGNETDRVLGKTPWQ